MLYKLLLLALAGACGTLSRYGLVSFVHRMSHGSFPLGTLEKVRVITCRAKEKAEDTLCNCSSQTGCT